MSLDTYANLKTAIATWLARPGDTNITANVSDLITLFEAEAKRRLRTRRQETTTTLVTVANTATVALPSDFGELRAIKYASNSTDIELEYMPPAQLDAAYPSQITGSPNAFTIEGSNIRLKSIPDTVYTLTITYIPVLTALSDSATTNWLLTNHPDAYLFGSLAEAEAMIGNDPRFPLWKARRDEVFASIERDDHKARWGGGALIMKTDTGNP